LFSVIDAKKIILEKQYKALLNKIADWRKTQQVVVLVSGDPCFFSYTKMIIKKFGIESCTIIPGISSIQLAFAAIGDYWEDACFVSLHGRNSGYKELIKKVKEYQKIGILTDQENSPAVIAQKLIKAGISKRKMFICENLSLPEEKIYEADLPSARKIKTKGAVVVIIKK